MADVVETKKYLDLEGTKLFKEKLEGVMDTKIADAADNYEAAGTAATEVQKLADGQVKLNKETIEKLNGADTVDGSVAKAVKDAVDVVDAKIGVVPEGKTVMGVVGEIQENAYDDTAITGRVTAVEGAIDTLNGTGDGSVKKQVDDAINAFATNLSDDNVVNTFKELVDYCATHSAEAAEMAGEIEANATAISDLEKYVGVLPEGTLATDVISYINEKVSSVDFTDAIATAKSEAIAAAATDATTKANQALADAKTYADGLAGDYATAEQGAKADTALQESDVAEGTVNGEFTVGTKQVKVHGLGDAAYQPATAFDVSGAADAVMGTDADVSTVITVKGTRKYVDEVKAQVDSIQPISTAEIDQIFATETV